MHRRSFLLGLMGAASVGLPAWAGYADDVVAQLASQGYQDISMTRTWLGRVRILAHRDGGTREIVLNPRTGEILRDLWTAADGTTRTVSIVDDVRSGGQSGSGRGSGGGSGSDDGGSGGSGSGGSDDGGTDSGSGSGGTSGGSGGGSSGGGSTDGGSTSGSDDGKSDGGALKNLLDGAERDKVRREDDKRIDVKRDQ